MGGCKMNHYHILYTSDINYFPHMMTSLCSLLENHMDTKLSVHIIQDRFTEENYQRLYHLSSKYPNLRLQIYPIEEVLKSIYQCHIPKWRGTDIANARLFSNEVIGETDKLLYLDCDTIVNSSLKELFQTSNGFPVSAVRELCVPSHLDDYQGTYYNSGVLLFDYTLWENLGCPRKLYDGAKKYHNILKYPDQDLLNLSLNGMIHDLGPGYNVHPTVYYINRHSYFSKKFYRKFSKYYSLGEVQNALEVPHILHTVEFIKARPWNDNSVHPFNDLYKKYRKIWDSGFELTPNENRISKVKSMVYIKLAADSMLSEDTLQNVKSLVKRVLPDRKGQ